MVTLTKREAAMQVIADMRVGEWVKLEELARKGRYGQFTLTNFEMMSVLKEARRQGLTEQRSFRMKFHGKEVYVSEWRRVKLLEVKNES